MNGTNWTDVFDLATAAWAHEPVGMQLAIGLGVALAAVLCVEGLYASVAPLRYTSKIVLRYPDRFLDHAETAPDAAALARRPLAAFVSAHPLRAPPRNFKLPVEVVRRRQSPRPQIKRASMVNPAHAEVAEPDPQQPPAGDAPGV